MSDKIDIWRGLIPIRSGSKSIKNKNIKDFNGKPLVYWATRAAIDSGIFNGGVFIAVDCNEYAEIVKKNIPDAVVIYRPDETATDTASSESVMHWFSELYPSDVISLIQVTSPGVTSSDFIEAQNIFVNTHSESLVTGVPFNRFLWKKNGSPVNYNPLNRPRRQDFENQIMENGSFYFTKTVILRKFNSRLGGKISVYEMDPINSIEIDEEEDFHELERLLKDKDNSRIKQIRVLVLDVDGTLTDGGMYYNENGEFLKKFNTKDGEAINEIKSIGIKVLVCTGEESASVTRRVEKLGIDNYIKGSKDKVRDISDWLSLNDLTWNNVLYVGDGLNDLDAMARSNFIVCPQDSHYKVKNIADIIFDTKGGEGIVRDVQRLIEGIL